MNATKRFLSLKTKIMVSTLIPVVVSFALISSVIFLSLFNSLNKTAKAEFLHISRKYAHSFETKINNAMNYLSILASDITMQAEAGTTDRETLQNKVMNIFDDYKLIDGSSVYFEPNMYDGKDAEYVGSQYGSDKSGRISWYYYIDDGKSAYLPWALEDDTEFDMPHYAEAKKANKPIYTDPIAHDIQGRIISMFTLTYPIQDRSGNFIGAVTVDLFLDDIYAQLQNEKIYETGYVIIANDNGLIIYSPHYEDIGKTRQEAGLDYPLPTGDEASDFFHAKSILNGKDTLVTINSIRIPQLDSHFYISIAAPLDEINAAGTRMMVILIVFGLFVVAAIALLLYYLIGRISAPLNEITESVNKIASGDYNARIKGDYKGEYAVVKDSVNTMACSIEAYIEESKNSLKILKNILNGLDAAIYVTVPDTGEILFINDYMKGLYNIEGDSVGLICYKVLQDGKDERCEYCPCFQLDKEPDSVVVWEEHSTLTKRDYRNTDRFIEWIGGGKAHLQHSVDITDIKKAQFALDRRLRQQSLMASISRSFLSDADIETLITNALRMTGEFLDVSQILYYKYEDDGVTFACLNEWINPQTGKQTSIGTRQVLPDALLAYIKSLPEKEDFCLNANSPALKALMAPYMVNFQNYISVPIFVKGKLYGALDFFREDSDKEWGDSDISLAALVSSLLSGVFERHSMESEVIAAKDLAEQGSRSKSEFLSRMSHEMRTPMNAIIGMTNIAKSSDDPAKKEYCLERIDNASRHLLGVINDILDMSKIEANKFDLSYSEFNFEMMLLNVLNVINFRMDEKQQVLSPSIDSAVPSSIIGDEQHLAQVITNLLTNAVKFTPEGGTIQLNVRKLGEENGTLTLQIEVVDSGIGISGEQQAKLFRSFEQADGSIARKFGGTGLGLAISKRIVELMGGEIWVESELGNGSKFAFTIQVQKGKDTTRETLKKHLNVGELNIMAVDDSPEVCEYFKHLMGEMGAPCVVASGGEEALSLFKSSPKPFDIVFIDWKMPEMNGIELSKELRKLPVKHPIIIMISASEWSDIEREASEAGVNGFIPKPLFPSLLMDCINRHLGGVTANPEPQEVAPKHSYENKTALLAEDVEINREIVLTVLEDSKLKIECAENGRQAVEMFAANPGKYDIIFMDVHMPEVDGLEATRRIRALDAPEGARVPILAMTANVFNEDIEKCLDAGMNDHIGKPIDFDELFKKLRKYLR